MAEPEPEPKPDEIAPLMISAILSPPEAKTGITDETQSITHSITQRIFLDVFFIAHNAPFAVKIRILLFKFIITQLFHFVKVSLF